MIWYVFFFYICIFMGLVNEKGKIDKIGDMLEY